MEIISKNPRIGKCVKCGNEVMLNGFTNTCQKCGADYNIAGNFLAPRQQWGEETGESVEAILSVDDDPYKALNDPED